jgi:hypothetical protein
LPIGETLILKGKDAKRFRKLAEENKNILLSKEELHKDYKFLKEKFNEE